RLLEREATSRGLTVEELTHVEIEAKAAPVRDEEIRATYEKNRERYGKETYDDVAEYLRESLKQQRVFQRRTEYLRQLRDKGGVEIILDAPRLPVSAADSPVLGPASAPVTIVVFSDYQCPFCARLAPTLRQIAERYG